ncbi:MAG: hypothetical protein JNM52_02175 [Betaproteobacteria bacterium]|nr:hypothetical protein [Betaproteobacteria bacterium]
MMNKRPISEAKDPDLPLVGIALERAARRAWEIAAQTGTLVVISRNGVIEYLSPHQVVSMPLKEALDIQVPPASDGKRG